MPDFDDEDGFFGPTIRRFIPMPEPFDEERDRDGGEFDWDEYWPYDYARAA